MTAGYTSVLHWPSQRVRQFPSAIEALLWIGVDPERAHEIAPRVEGGETLGTCVHAHADFDAGYERPPWSVDERLGPDLALAAKAEDGTYGAWLSRGGMAMRDEAAAVAIAQEQEQRNGGTWSLLVMVAPALAKWGRQ